MFEFDPESITYEYSTYYYYSTVEYSKILKTLFTYILYSMYIQKKLKIFVFGFGYVLRLNWPNRHETRQGCSEGCTRAYLQR